MSMTAADDLLICFQGQCPGEITNLYYIDDKFVANCSSARNSSIYSFVDENNATLVQTAWDCSSAKLHSDFEADYVFTHAQLKQCQKTCFVEDQFLALNTVNSCVSLCGADIFSEFFEADTMRRCTAVC